VNYVPDQNLTPVALARRPAAIHNAHMLPWRYALGLFRDLVFPDSCLACERTLAADEGPWCLPCAQEVSAAVATDYCPRCGSSAAPHLASAEGCPDCRAHRNPLDGLARVGPYQGIIRDLVLAFKYHRRQRLDRPLAALLAAAIQGQPWADELEALVPVPTNWRGRLRYRFHPVGLIARMAGQHLALPALLVVEVRGKKRRQMELPASSRPANVHGVFRTCPRAQIQGTTLCIVDDVATTGATLREVAHALREAGAARVYAAVLAKTAPDEAAILRA